MAGKRDLRIDLLRGAAIVAMIVDHVGGDGSWLYPLTGGNRFFVSAAEGFIFLSGLTAGIVYMGVAAREGLGSAIWKLLRRAAVLYLWTVGLTLILPALANRLDIGWDDPFQGISPADFAVSVLTLHRTYHLLDVLLLYVLLFSCGCVALALIAEGRTPVVLAFSWGVWATWQIWPQYADLPWNIVGMDVFQFAAWQALFFTGIAIGAHRREIAQQLARVPLTAYLVAGGAGLAAAIGFYQHELQALVLIAPRANAQMLADHLFSKSDLRIGRLIVFACLAAFSFSLVTLGWQRVERLTGWLLLPLGQNSLTTYALHVGVVAGLTKLGTIAFGDGGRGIEQNTVLQLTGVFGVWLIVQGFIDVKAWWSERGWRWALSSSKRQLGSSATLPVPVADEGQARQAA